MATDVGCITDTIDYYACRRQSRDYFLILQYGRDSMYAVVIKKLYNLYYR